MADLLSHLQFLDFQAARRLPRAPAGLPEGRPHGHGFRLAARFAQAPLVNRLAAARLASAAAGLDYQSLDSFCVDPTDVRILGMLANQAELSTGAADLALQSAPGRGVRRDAQGGLSAWCAFRFESAHRLPNVPPGHKCGRLHGHGFRAEIHIPAGLDEPGWHVDYARLDAAWAPLHAQLHHRHLNDLAGLENPTSEWLAVWIWNAIRAALPDCRWVTVYETDSCGAHYDGQRHRIWKDFTIDSAACTPEVTLGHTWTLRLHLSGELHPVFGWAMDFADVKREFDPLFRSLDHQPLHAVEGLDTPDSAGLARWIRRHAHLVLPSLGRVDVLDGCGAGVSLDWGQGGLAPLP